MSIAVTYRSQVTVVETLGGAFVDPSDATVTSSLNTEKSLTSSTTPPVTKQSSGTQALTAGAVTLDLTSLPDLNGTAGAVTFTGLKLATAKFKNPSSNANAMTIVFGATNGCTSLGTGFNITLQPGAEVTFQGNDAEPDVDATHKTFDVTGTGAQVLHFHFTAG